MTKKKQTNKLIIVLSVLVVVLIIVAIVGKQKGWIGKGKAIQVELANSEKREIVEKVSASGKVQPEIELKISPDVSGEIIELNVREGDSVDKGELLLRIRPDIFINQLDQAKANANNVRANLAQMRANLARAEAQKEMTQFNFDRNKSLFEQKAIAESEFQQSETNLNVANQDLIAAKENVKAAEFNLQNSQAAVRVAEDNLRFTRIYAPEGGIISKLNVEKGERVVGTSQMQGTEMLRIADLNKMEVRVDVNENDIIRVSLGDTVEIEVDSYSSEDEKFKGLVTEIANSPNDESLTSETITEFEVRIKIINSSYSHLIKNDRPYPFKPGMTASVDIITDRKSDVLSVPLSSVTTRTEKELAEDNDEKKGFRGGRRGGEDEVESEESKTEELKEIVFVYNPETKKAESREVKTGISDFDNIEIKDGIKNGEQIIIGPYLAVSKLLKDGSEVEESKGKKAGIRRE